MINTFFWRMEPDLDYKISDAEYIINSRLFHGASGYRAVSFDMFNNPMPVAFRKHATDPGRSTLTTYQEVGVLTVIVSWDNEGHFRVHLQDLEHGQRQVFEDFGPDMEKWRELQKTNDWLRAWLFDGVGKEEHYLPLDVFPESKDRTVFDLDVSYSKFIRTYPGVECFISVDMWRSCGVDGRMLSAEGVTVEEALKIAEYCRQPNRVYTVCTGHADDRKCHADFLPRRGNRMITAGTLDGHSEIKIYKVL